MKRIFHLILFCAAGFICAVPPGAQARVVKKKAPAVQSVGHVKHPIRATAPKPRTKAGKASSKTTRVSGRAGKRGRYRQVAAAPPVATWRRGQMEPSPDRYREIQQALASKGYLKSEPNGNWDSDSQEALRRFQADQKLDQSGTITAKSLIQLGLGPAKQ